MQQTLCWGGLKITADGDCSHEIKGCLLLGRKVMTNLDSRDITLPTSVHLVEAMVFPVVMYESSIYELDYIESWALKNWCFWTVVLEKTLESPWTARRSNQSILKEISLDILWMDWCWSWNSNTLATWCEELTHLKRPWSWERLRVGGEGDNRGWDGWMASPTQWTWVWVISGIWWWTGRPGVLHSMGSQRVEHNWMTELNWTEDPTILLLGI